MATFTYAPTVTMTGCATTINQNTLTVAASAAGSWAVAIGATIVHANIPEGTTILSYNTPTQAVMSQNATATGSSLSIIATNPTIINMDQITSVLKGGGDTYNINGTKILVDQDSRWGLNQPVNGVLGPVTISATMGGTFTIDGRKIRIIPFENGSGNVPVSNTLITQGDASGKLICVMSAINATPIAAGSTMPASGFIKIKQWNGVEYTSGALTNIIADSTGVSKVGWLEIVGANSATVTANRLGLYEVKGEWFEVGVCTGVNTDTYQIPTMGYYTWIPGVWVETNVADEYEFYPCVGTGSLTVPATSAVMSTDEIRGKNCWCSITGALRFQHDGTNATGGYLPPNGRKIRIPNIIMQCSSSYATNCQPDQTTLGTRYDFTTTGGGVLTFDKCMMSWYPSISQANSVSMSNMCIASALSLSEIASPMIFNNVHIGSGDMLGTVALTMSLCFAGGTFTDCTWRSLSLAGTGRYTSSMVDISGFNFIRNRFSAALTRGHATTGNITGTRIDNCYFEDTIIGNGRILMATTTRTQFKNTIYYDHPATTTIATYPHYIFDMSAKCNDVKMDGVSFGGLFGCAPYSGILSIGAAGCSNIKLRNLGTSTEPLSAGGEVERNCTWARTTTTATVTTSDAHQLKVNDTVYVLVSDSVGAITVGAKTVTSVPTSTTFTFTCLNAGASSGVLTYELQIMALVFALGTGAAANNVEVKRVYMPQTRTRLYSVDNSSKNIRLENLWGARFQSSTSAMLNGYQKGIQMTNALTATTGVYGTHWIDTYIHSPTTSMNAQSWSRTTTVCTVTSVDHRLLTGALINVIASSSAAAVRLTQFSVTVLTKDTFTFTCVDAGDASGTLSYVPFNGRINLMMNESTADTANVYTIDNGTPGFTAAGGLFMSKVNDQVTFTTDYYIIGHKSFPIAEAVMGGGTIANYDITYAIDHGAGYGTFHNLYYARPGGSGSSGAYTFTVTDATGVEVGDYIWGTNIGYNAKVTDIVGNTITTDTANVGTVSGIIRFNHLPSETITNPEAGFKMKWRFKTAKANATAISSLYVWTFSTDTERAYQYPLDIITATITLTGIVDGTEVGIYRTADQFEYFHTDSVSGGTISYSYGYTSDIPIYIVIHHKEYEYIKIDAVLTANNLIAPIQQKLDRWYSNPA